MHLDFSVCYSGQKQQMVLIAVITFAKEENVFLIGVFFSKINTKIYFSCTFQENPPQMFTLANSISVLID